MKPLTWMAHAQGYILKTELLKDSLRGRLEICFCCGCLLTFIIIFFCSTYGRQRKTLRALDAQKKFKQGLSSYTDNAELMIQLADTYIILQQLPEADKFYKLAINTATKNQTKLTACVKYAQMLLGQGQTKEAEGYFQQALELDGSSSLALISYVTFLRKWKRNDEEAQRLYEKHRELKTVDAITSIEPRTLLDSSPLPLLYTTCTNFHHHIADYKRFFENHTSLSAIGKPFISIP